MAGKMASLAKDTTIYGLSSIIGRFLNYLLVPIYTRQLEAQSDYGIMTEVYSWTAMLLVILTFGMETTLFRFANKEGQDPKRVFSTNLIFVGSISALFVAICYVFNNPISATLRLNPDYIRIMSLVVALDAFQAIIFSYLRLQKRAVKFASLKLFFIFMSLALNLTIIYFVPKIYQNYPLLFGWFNKADLVEYVFAINLFCTGIVTFGFIPEIKELRNGFDGKLFGKMFSYTVPILILGIAGILNQVADKILYKHLIPGESGESQLGEYGAAIKIAMIMALLTQAFRYAYEPMVFNASKESVNQNNKMYADAMKYFIIFSIAAFLAVVLYLDIFMLILGPEYRAGAKVVPIVMIAEIFMGIYFNLSFWYKLADKTWWGAAFSLIGCGVLIAINYFFVPKFGYMACAWGGFAGYGTCMILSYFVGMKYSPVKYPIREISVYVAIGAVIWYLSGLLEPLPVWMRLVLRTGLLLCYFAYLVKKDMPLKSLPVIGKYFRR
jgi:O-antigen/teichoic acid export membrane protein